MYKAIIKLLTLIHNYSYKLINILITKYNNQIHPKHEIMKYHNFFLDNINSNDKVLDIGCGNGAVAFDLATKAQYVVGIDNNLNNVNFALKNYKKSNLKFIFGNCLTYNWQKKFDKIILSNVLEHIENRINFLEKLHKLSNTILLRVPLITRSWLAVYKKRIGVEYRLDKSHYIEYTLDELNRETNNAGWKICSYSVQFGEFWGIIKSNY